MGELVRVVAGITRALIGALDRILIGKLAVIVAVGYNGTSQIHLDLAWIQ